MVGPIERQASLQRRRCVGGLCLEGRYMDVSENSGFSPQIIHFNRVFHYKPIHFGVPLFWKHPQVDDEMDYLLWFEEAPMLPSYRLDMFFICSMFFLIWRWKRSCRDSGSLIFLHPRDSVHLHFQSLHNPIKFFFQQKNLNIQLTKKDTNFGHLFWFIIFVGLVAATSSRLTGPPCECWDVSLAKNPRNLPRSSPAKAKTLW